MTGRQNEKISPKRRLLSALFGGRTGDRPPVGNPTSIVSIELMEKTGIFFPQAHLEAQPMAELAAAGHEILGFDSIMPEYSVQQEAAALGCEMDWGSPSMMPDARTHPVQRIEDLIIPENLLEKPSLKVVLEALSHFTPTIRRRCGHHRKSDGALDDLLPSGRNPELSPLGRYRPGQGAPLPGGFKRGHGTLRQSAVPGWSRCGGPGRPCHRRPGRPQDLRKVPASRSQGNGPADRRAADPAYLRKLRGPAAHVCGSRI